MFPNKVQKRQHDFDPFNLARKDKGLEKKIKFERLSKSVKTKPLWLMVLVFALACILYWYMIKNI